MKSHSEQIRDIKDLKLSKGDFVVQHTGVKFKDYYKVMDNKLLGEGAFGKVKKCVNIKTKIVHAVKVMEKSKMDKNEKIRLSYEIDILKNLDHPNIVKLYEVFEDDRNIYLVTELCTGGELFDIISDRTFTEREAADIIKQVLQAIAYCHKQKVAHRDMKPENILIDSTESNKMVVKIIDFGTSQVFDAKEKMTQAFGTCYYVAPEVLQEVYTEKCDIWSIGVILYILLSGEPPFNGVDDTAILDQVKLGLYSFKNEIWKKRSN